MSSGFERRKEQSREEIRRAAWELFGQFGVERVSIADIARKAGVSQQTIYNNFAGKEDLVREFVAAVVDSLVARFKNVLAPDLPFAEKMPAFLAAIGDVMASGAPSEAAATVFTTSTDLQADGEIRKIRAAATEQMTGMLLQLVKEGREQGQVDPGVSDAALAVYFRAFMDIFVDPQLQRRFGSQAAFVGELGSLMLYGLRGPAGNLR